MEIRKLVSKEERVGYQCDVCAARDENGTYATLGGIFGYYSDKDQETHLCHLCERCYDKVREFVEVTLGGKVHIGYYQIAAGADEY